MSSSYNREKIKKIVLHFAVHQSVKYGKPKQITDDIIQETPDPSNHNPITNLLEPVKFKDETSFHTDSGDFLYCSPKTTVKEDALDKLNIVAGLETSMQSDFMPKKVMKWYI